MQWFDVDKKGLSKLMLLAGQVAQLALTTPEAFAMLVRT